MQLKEKYNKLENEVHSHYDKLISHMNERKAVSELTYLYSINITDEIMGGCYHVYIKSFNLDGTFTAVDVENDHIEKYTLDNIYSLFDKIEAVTLLQSIVMNNLENIINK